MNCSAKIYNGDEGGSRVISRYGKDSQANGPLRECRNPHGSIGLQGLSDFGRGGGVAGSRLYITLHKIVLFCQLGTGQLCWLPIKRVRLNTCRQLVRKIADLSLSSLLTIPERKTGP
jgi:hypothetical protein